MHSPTVQALIVYGVTAAISFLVAALIRLLYLLLRTARKETP